MNALDVAVKFFHACESAEGWSGCRDYAAADATFHSCAPSYRGMETLNDYCEQVAGAFQTTFAGSAYELVASAHDAATDTVIVQGLSLAEHTGDGGPVPPTRIRARIPFVYSMQMGPDNKIAHVEKIYDEASSRRQLGWPVD
ncbi:hypothetical protein [Gordonia sp. (in: high G+C Gram-positive bacteria)]|uniref:hypothetical protein n=1 Tax=Gordonia sp. (in: high G+C Gram-positive bacteria) TaxID=84139 RepID=UPI003C783F3B